MTTSRKLTPAHALAMSCVDVTLSESYWTNLSALQRKVWLQDARRQLRFLSKLGFTVVAKPAAKDRRKGTGK